MAVFTLDLDETARAKLEAHRRRLGARSLADAIRLLIDPVPDETPKIKSRLKGEWKAP